LLPPCGGGLEGFVFRPCFAPLLEQLLHPTLGPGRERREFFVGRVSFKRVRGGWVVSRGSLSFRCGLVALTLGRGLGVNLDDAADCLKKARAVIDYRSV